MIKSDKWVFKVADNTAKAITLIKQDIAAEHRPKN
jgi:hypothetical protein